MRKTDVPWSQVHALLDKIIVAVQAAGHLSHQDKLAAIAFNFDKACKFLNIVVGPEGPIETVLRLQGDIADQKAFVLEDEPCTIVVFEEGTLNLDDAVQDDIAYAGSYTKTGSSLSFKDRTQASTPTTSASSTSSESKEDKQQQGIEIPLIMTFGASVGIALAQAMQQRKSSLVKEM